jgi:hypothetical protein
VPEDRYTNVYRTDVLSASSSPSAADGTAAARILLFESAMADVEDTGAPTVEQSLDVLSEVVAKAAEDMEAAHGAIEMARDEIASRNGEVPRAVIVAATRAIDHLRRADEALRDVLRELAQHE